MPRISHMLLIGMVSLAGCQNVNGPFKPRPPVRVDDPVLSLKEQEKLGRARLSLPEQSVKVLPQTGGGLPEAPGFR